MNAYTHVRSLYPTPFWKGRVSMVKRLKQAQPWGDPRTLPHTHTHSSFPPIMREAVSAYTHMCSITPPLRKRERIRTHPSFSPLHEASHEHF